MYKKNATFHIIFFFLLRITTQFWKNVKELASPFIKILFNFQNIDSLLRFIDIVLIKKIWPLFSNLFWVPGFGSHWVPGLGSLFHLSPLKMAMETTRVFIFYVFIFQCSAPLWFWIIHICWMLCFYLLAIINVLVFICCSLHTTHQGFICLFVSYNLFPTK